MMLLLRNAEMACSHMADLLGCSIAYPVLQGCGLVVLFRFNFLLLPGVCGGRRWQWYPPASGFQFPIAVNLK